MWLLICSCTGSSQIVAAVPRAGIRCSTARGTAWGEEERPRSLLWSCGRERKTSYLVLCRGSASHLKTRSICTETGVRCGPCSSVSTCVLVIAQVFF